MSLDFMLVIEDSEVFSNNITHNLGRMAKEAGIYDALWRPLETGYTTAAELIPTLEAGLIDLEANPAYYQEFNAANGWGKYENFVPFVREILAACRECPNATIVTSV